MSVGGGGVARGEVASEEDVDRATFEGALRVLVGGADDQVVAAVVVMPQTNPRCATLAASALNACPSMITTGTSALIVSP